MNIPCNVILDLIPLVKDGVSSDESTQIVYEHINNCQSCKGELEIYEDFNQGHQPLKDENIINDIKRSIYLTQIIVLVVGTIIGVALSNSMGMFYNFIIMPIIGSISFIAFKRKWYVTPLAIFILTYLWQTTTGIIVEGFTWSRLYIGLFYSVIYVILIIMGVVITILLKYAFKKGE